MLTRQILNIIKKYEMSILLLGPRQTGKSTLIQSPQPQFSINLADQEEYWFTGF